MAGDILTDFQQLRKLIVLIVTPIVLVAIFYSTPYPINFFTTEGRCAFVVILMAVYWLTESMPIPITALMPLVLFPLLNVVPAKTIAKAYMNDTIMVFMGGLCVAVAIEHWNIHRRIALRILMLVGAEPRWLMLGLMIATWFLSMWISNTATTAMMIPIANAVLLQLKDTGSAADLPEENGTVAETGTELTDVKDGDVKDANVGTTVSCVAEDEMASPERPWRTEQYYKDLSKALSLCIAYAANSGGIASLTGSPPNLVLKGVSDDLFSKYGIDSPVNFATWMAYGFPLSVIVLVVCWLWLNIFYLGRDLCSCISKNSMKIVQARKVKNVIVTEYKKLGPIIFAQGCVMAVFATLVVLWISRDLGGVGGWGDLFPPKTVSDSTPSTLLTILLFIIPSKLPRVFCCRKNVYQLTEEEQAEEKKPILPLLTWNVVHEKMPWGLFLLLGGGYALAQGCEVSGLSTLVGTELRVLEGLNSTLILLIICYVCAAATEVTSNTATATLMMPILSNLAIGTGVNPLFYMFPAAISVSFAYMLPVATPPNAIVFSYGHIRVSDMAKAGLMMNIVAVPLLVVATITWGNAIFHFDVVQGAFRRNETLVANATTV